MPTDRKILSLDALLALRQEAGRAGRTVVHCHGCFDIVHPGHIHHLEFARSLGDILLVTVSADPHVNKGIDRPLIPEDLRARSLAALECVDAVLINSEPTAVRLLEALQPDIYVKGSEYEQNSDPRFLAEREIVTRHGGRVVFSSGDVVYSSTALIGALGAAGGSLGAAGGSLSGAGRFQDEKVHRLRDRNALDGATLRRLLERGRGMKVLVVGDYILDRYHFCETVGVAGEGPMLSLRPLQCRDYDGGAGIVALHLAAMGARPTLVSALADDELSSGISMRLAAAGVDVQCHGGRREVVCKHRYLVDQTKLFKVDEGSRTPGDSQLEGLVAAKILAAAEGADAVILVDFGYGMLTAGLLARILPELRKRVPILAGDVSGPHSGLLHFRDVDLLCPTEHEAREALRDFSGGLGAVVWNLLHTTGARQAIITLGKQGLVTFDGSERPLPARLRSEYLPALGAQTIDPLGCGDALLAAATLTLAAGGSLAAAAFVGSIAAAIEAGEIGNEPVGSNRLLTCLRECDEARAATRLAS